MIRCLSTPWRWPSKTKEIPSRMIWIMQTPYTHSVGGRHLKIYRFRIIKLWEVAPYKRVIIQSISFAKAHPHMEAANLNQRSSFHIRIQTVTCICWTDQRLLCYRQQSRWQWMKFWLKPQVVDLGQTEVIRMKPERRLSKSLWHPMSSMSLREGVLNMWSGRKETERKNCENIKNCCLTVTHQMEGEKLPTMNVVRCVDNNCMGIKAKRSFSHHRHLRLNLKAPS